MEIEKYLIFFFIGYVLNQLLKNSSKWLKHERRRLIRQHVRHHHVGSVRTCLEPDCQPLRHL
jgi:hypothetical protein